MITTSSWPSIWPTWTAAAGRSLTDSNLLSRILFYICGIYIVIRLLHMRVSRGFDSILVCLSLCKEAPYI